MAVGWRDVGQAVILVEGMIMRVAGLPHIEVLANREIEQANINVPKTLILLQFLAPAST